MTKGFDPTRFLWPIPWQPITDEAEALSFGRWYTTTVGLPPVADTVLGELRREIGAGHPLAGVECRAIAWESGSRKDFLFLTARRDMPVVSVHFTWGFEQDPAWPFVIVYRNLTEFVRRERRWIVEVRAQVLGLWRAFNGG